MDNTTALVQSSPETRSWLQSIRERFTDVEYSEAKYYAVFRTEPGGRPFAYLNPLKRSVRLFLPLDPNDSLKLQPTPSKSYWAARFPAVYRIGGGQDLAIAVRLIAKSLVVVDRGSNTAGESSKGARVRRSEFMTAQELAPETKYVEGAVRLVLVNAYERNRKARDHCLRHYGCTCVICGFNFEQCYGEAAAGYIQVHHMVPIAEIGMQYRLDPFSDLRPICPNCHAVLHICDPPLSIEDVRKMLKGVGGRW